MSYKKGDQVIALLDDRSLRNYGSHVANIIKTEIGTILVADGAKYWTISYTNRMYLTLHENQIRLARSTKLEMI